MSAPIVAWWRDWSAQLRTVRLTPTAGVVAFALMMLCWLTDIAVLALAFLALHTPPPWAGLLLGLLRRADRGEHAGDPWRDRDHGGQHHAGPGGLRGAQTITLAAVMLYRLIAYWGCIPAGGLAWLVLRASSRAPTPPVASQANVNLQQPTRAPEPIP